MYYFSNKAAELNILSILMQQLVDLGSSIPLAQVLQTSKLGKNDFHWSLGSLIERECVWVTQHEKLAITLRGIREIEKRVKIRDVKVDEIAWVDFRVFSSPKATGILG